MFASIGSVTAQEVSDYSKLQPSDYSSITLPPLDLLFENAKSAPTYELASVKVYGAATNMVCSVTSLLIPM